MNCIIGYLIRNRRCAPWESSRWACAKIGDESSSAPLDDESRFLRLAEKWWSHVTHCNVRVKPHREGVESRQERRKVAWIEVEDLLASTVTTNIRFMAWCLHSVPEKKNRRFCQNKKNRVKSSSSTSSLHDGVWSVTSSGRSKELMIRRVCQALIIRKRTMPLA